MIGIEGSWVLLIDIGSVQDAIRPEDLESFQITEQAGLALPTFILKFATSNEQVTPFLNELANIAISFGKTSANLHACNVFATEIHMHKDGDNRRHVEMQGLLNYPDYLSSNVVGITDNMSGVEALLAMAKRQGFNLGQDNITRSEDKQNWIQPNIPDKRFGTHLWLHSKLTNSFPIVGISVLDETFRVLDARKQIKKGKADWEFTFTEPTAANQITYNGHCTIHNSTGFVNAWVGYKREYLEYNAQTGQTKKLSFTVEPMLSLTRNMPTLGVAPRFGDVVMLPDCVDVDFNLTFQRNLAYLAQFSCFRVDMQFVNNFQPIKILDLAYYRDDSTEKPKVSTSDYASGLFLVSQVSHVFTARRYTCSVMLDREAPGDVADGTSAS